MDRSCAAIWRRITRLTASGRPIWPRNGAKTTARRFNAGRTPVLEQEFKFIELNPQNFEQMQLAKASRIAAVEICKLFNVRPSCIDETEHANRSTAQTELDLLYRLAPAREAERVAIKSAGNCSPRRNGPPAIRSASISKAGFAARTPASPAPSTR
jgi:phage portal protein BeeE